MHRIRATLAALLLVSSASAARADIDKAGTTAANFLSVGQGASVLGMAGAGLGFAHDLNSVTWNSASLARLPETQIAFSHASLAQESSQEWAAMGGRWKQSNTFWSASGLYQGNGEFDGRDALGNSTGSFSSSSMALGMNVAHAISPTASFGLGAQFVSENLGTMTGSGMTFNAGFLMQRGIFGFGASAQNMLGKMRYNNVPYPFPGNLGVGMSVSDPARGLRLAVDLNMPDAYYTDVRTGLEWRYKDHLALRTGYRMEMGAESGEPLGGPTFGMGAGSNGFWFDYAFITGGASEASEHRIGLTFRPGAFNMSTLGAQADASDAKPSSTAVAQSVPAEKESKTSKSAPKQTAAEPTLDTAPPRPTSAPAKASETTASAAKPVATAAEKPVAAATAAPRYVAPIAAGVPLAAQPDAKSAATQPDAKSAATQPNAKSAAVQPNAQSAAAQPNAKSAAAQPDAKSAAAQPDAKSAAEQPSAKSLAEQPVASELLVQPDAKSVAAQPNAKSAATQPDAKSAAAQPDAKSAATQPIAKSSAPAAASGWESVLAAPPAVAAAKPPTVDAAKSAPTAISEPAKPAPASATTATTSTAAATPKVAVQAPAAAAPAAATQSAMPRPAKVTLKKGESLATLAERWGTSVAAIMMENNLVTDQVKPGKELKLPAASRR